ncbi:MAG: Asp23/Gls24 family envelope stress response protein [Xylanivirga thermophila]|jgi:uncharacterized alkaline shock family protein YloU|uniref:Asp23/Gls24 family envelope stress response protein n=1 Tax=Xylanivirga thermophila TaxID=2496273 RepID=UPI0039F6189D
MEVYALVGPSGTGKSYRAISFANEMGILYIIDDGLLIKDNRILAGVSAKKEPTKLAAVRRALFIDSDHAQQVSQAIEMENPPSILVLGTSVNMINKIVAALNLPKVSHIISIYDIASKKEIALAKQQRNEEGKHIIPVPTFEVRKDFSGYFIDALNMFKISPKGRMLQSIEKTVVRPTFSYMGKFYISNSAIQSIIIYSTKNIEGVSRVLKVSVISQEDGVVINIDVEVYYNMKIIDILKEIQRRVEENISWTTGLNIISINVNAKGIVIPEHI